jgi:DNA-binding Xre family transcriptional regulator
LALDRLPAVAFRPYAGWVARVILAAVLKRKGISKRQFARLIGVDYHNVFRLFREGTDPRFSTLSKWAKALNCKVRDLIRE